MRASRDPVSAPRETWRDGHSRAVTPPKGRPTPRRGQQQRVTARRTSRRSQLQWAMVAIVVLAVVAAVAVLGGGGGGTPTHGVPLGHGG